MIYGLYIRHNFDDEKPDGVDYNADGTWDEFIAECKPWTMTADEFNTAKDFGEWYLYELPSEWIEYVDMIINTYLQND